MSMSAHQTAARTDGALDRRREPREELLRVVEYTAFPRADAEPRSCFGFTRDVSPRGLCMGVERSESVGALLRLAIREVDGTPGSVAIARVVWCGAERDGRYWLGLERVGEPIVD